MSIVEVTNPRLLKEFIEFPDRLYKDCPQYVPALHSDQRKSLTECASLKYCSRKMWLSKDNSGKVTGRICAMINPRYNELYGKKCCRFGWFDVIEDFDTAETLVETAVKWASENGMTQIHGPLYYNTLGKQGMLVEGFSNVPQFNTLYNFRYYPEFIERMGFVKECDWIQYRIDTCEVPERIERIASILTRKYELHFEDIDVLKKDPARVRSFLKLYSDIYARNVYNFIPFTEDEMAEEENASIPMLSRRYCTIISGSDNEIAAFGISFPSISHALQKARGRLFPFGWIHLIKALKCKNDTCDLMLTGASEKWQGKGLSSILHVDMSGKFAEMGIRHFITNPQIETNSAAFVWENYPHELFMRRRCYIKNI